MERIFIDKIFAAEFYYSIPEERKYTETAKHLYDLAVLSSLPEIKTLLCDKKMCAYLADLKRGEEVLRHNRNLSDKPFSAFIVFHKFDNDTEFLRAYATMQKIYVPDANDIIPIEKLRKAIDIIDDQIGAWNF